MYVPHKWREEVKINFSHPVRIILQPYLYLCETIHGCPRPALRRSRSSSRSKPRCCCQHSTQSVGVKLDQSYHNLACQHAGRYTKWRLKQGEKRFCWETTRQKKKKKKHTEGGCCQAHWNHRCIVCRWAVQEMLSSQWMDVIQLLGLKSSRVSHIFMCWSVFEMQIETVCECVLLSWCLLTSVTSVCEWLACCKA